MSKNNIFGRNIGNAVHQAINSGNIDDLVRNISITASEIARTVQDATSAHPGPNQQFPGGPTPGPNEPGWPFAPPRQPPQPPPPAPQGDFTQRTKHDYESQREQARQGYERQREAARQAYERQREQMRRNRGAPPQPRQQPQHQQPVYTAVPMPPQNAAMRALRSCGASGTALTVFGGLLATVTIAIFSIALAGVAAIASLALSAAAVSSALLSCGALLCATSAAMLTGGISSRRRAKRGKEYLKLAGSASFVAINRLAAGTNRDKAFLARDLRKMIRRGLLPGAHVDEQGTCLMLDDNTYRQYLETEDNLKQRERDEALKEEQEKADPQAAQLRRTVAEGRQYLRQIEEANDAIPGEAISAKLARLAEVTDKIFTCVEQRPSKLPGIRKFMNYYLPTTLKLVSAYREFESQPVQGDNIVGAKAEIESALGTIIIAFENLLNELYQEDAIDISTDISALKSVLTQDGLAGSGMGAEAANEPPAPELVIEPQEEA